MDLRKGDVGYVTGRRGLWTIIGGAPCPDNIVPCSESARRMSEASDPIAVWSPRQGTAIIIREDFTPCIDAILKWKCVAEQEPRT